MSGLLVSLAWCSLQVTLVAVLAWLLCGLARRMSASHAAALPATALAAVIVLTALAFVPWPRSWSYGPELSWRGETQQSDDGAESAKEESPAERVPPIAVNAPLQPEMDPVPAVELPKPAKDDLATDSLRNEVPHSARGVSPAAIPTPAIPAIAPPSPPLPRAWPWPSILLSLLALGAAAGLLQLLAGLVAAQSYRRKSCPIEDRALHELADVLCAQLRCRARVELRETSSLATAATIGWRKPLVLLPLEWRDWTAEQLRAVLAHEIAHIARHDFLACVLAQAGLALHFYHPLVHWLVRRLRLEQELAADAAAAMATGGRAAYLQSLAELALRQSERPLGWPARTFLPTRGTFMRRIEMLRDAKNGPAGESRWLAWPRRLAVLLLIIGAVAVAGLRGGAPPADVVQAQDKPKAKEELKAGEETKEAQPDSGEISVAQLPSDCLAFAAIRIQPLLKNPETAEVLRKLDQRTAESKAAVPLEKISQITLVMQTDQRMQAIIVEAAEAVDFSKTLLTEDNGKEAGIEEVKEADLKAGIERPTIVFTRLNDRAAAFGNREALARYFARKRGGAPLVRGDGWKQVSGRPLVVAIDMIAMRGLVPPDEGPAEILKRAWLDSLWDETESIAVGVALEKKADIRVVAECLGEIGAAKVALLAGEQTGRESGAIRVRNLLREMRTARLRQAADNLGARTIEEPEFIQLLYDAADKALSNAKVEQKESLITANASIDLKGRVGALSAFVPNIDALRVNGRRAESANNIKQILLAMHNYHDTHRHFPPAVIYGRDGKGKVPHSWRVELLPYLEQDALYRAYQFDEPWDSDANKKVLAQMPAVFRDPSADPRSIKSAYYVMVGKANEVKKDEGAGGAGAAGPARGGASSGVAQGGGAAPPVPAVGAEGATPPAPGGADEGVVVDTSLPTAFSKKDGIGFGEITDGTSNTIAVVEAQRDIPWTKPEDIQYDPKGKGPKLGGFYEDGFHAGFCDGAVKFLPAYTTEESLRAYLSPAAGDPIVDQKPISPAGLKLTPVERTKPRGR
jgi:beta-lactamase regulating signal transducer with metallopeptidase domain